MNVNPKLLLLVCLLSCKFPTRQVLDQQEYKQYIDQFNHQDTLNLHVDVIPETKMIPNEQSWNFLAKNIPFLSCPDKEIEEVYYYRWWTFRKHIKETADGYVVTEFMPAVSWAGKYNSISCPAGHHFREGRWLRDPKIIRDYGLFWLRKGGNPYVYSFWIAESFLNYHMVHPDAALLSDVLPDLIVNYKEWQNRRQDPDGLFWQYDGQDGMEVAIGGTGKRPTINSYMYADARAISYIAGLNGLKDIQTQYLSEAEKTKSLVLDKLWDKRADFFKVIPRSELPNDKAADTLSSARELLGFVPWYVNLVPKNQGYEKAWKQLMDPEGFYAPFGPTTAEQRHPGFKVSYEGHECQWNGPSWPFATSETLTALANVLNDYDQDVVSKEDFFQTFKNYTKSHRFRQIPPDADTIVTNDLWIDENLNPFNGDWLARTRMEVQGHNHGFKERGIYYNHSTYNDNVITGLIGLRPSLDDTLTINPLVPSNWDWFCLEHIFYKGADLTVLWDKNGDKYHRGKGLRVYADGKLLIKSDVITKLSTKLK
jgi:hypothetical protein